MDTIMTKNVARLCGVGVNTVSRTINNRPDISEETKQEILRVIKENHCIPNNSTRNLKRSASKAIVVLIKDIDNPFSSGMIKIFEEKIQKKRYSFILRHVGEGEDEVDVAIELVREKKLEGIIFPDDYFSHSQAKLDQLGISFVLGTIAITDKMEAGKFSGMSMDDFTGSYKMVDYLCGLDHKHIGILAATPYDESIGKLYLEGYRKVLEDNGITPREEWRFYSQEDIGYYTMFNGYELMNEVMAPDTGVTAVFTVSDSIAVGACKAMFDAGKSVPRGYCMAGFDGLDMAHHYNPAITTIRQSVEKMTHATIRILFDIIRNKSQNQRRIFQTQLLEGQSMRRI